MSLRNTLTLTLAGIGLYVLVAVGLVSLAVTRSTGPHLTGGGITEIFLALNQRAHRMDDLSRRVHRVVMGLEVAEAEAVGALWESVARGTSRTFERPFAEVPPPMRQPLAAADAEMARLEAVFVEVLALVSLGRLEEARARMEAADLLTRSVRLRMEEAQMAAVADLAERSRNLGETARALRSGVLLWLLGWALILPLVALLAHRRVRVPLERLERALNQVAGGDLTARVAVARQDETGRLAGHFNEMTRVLRNRAEEQGRLAAAGELVAGVAHEINNPLMAITATAEGRLDDPQLGQPARNDLQQILRQARRAGTLVRGLLRFVRRPEGEREAVDLNLIVAEALELVSYSLPVDEIQVERRLAPDLPQVRAEASGMEQILVNLLSNSIRALRDSGHPRRITVASWAEGEFCVLAVADNGPGIPPGAEERIFHPFTTTKGGAGTGLGLYISRQLAQGMGGDLVFAPGPGPGATFRLRLRKISEEAATEEGLRPPAAPARVSSPSPEGAPAPAPAEPPSFSGLRVMVVDDEPAIRRPLAGFLRRKGAQVVEASDGLDALTHLERFGADVILVDLRMPRMDGVEFYREILRDHPHLAGSVIILSGDLQQLEEAEGILFPSDRVLAKPVELGLLHERILAVARGTG